MAAPVGRDLVRALHLGDADQDGSSGESTLIVKPVMPDTSGRVYWLVTSSGNVYAFGDAPDYSSPSALGLVTSAVRTPDGKGYWILYSDGKVASFGDAAHLGSLPTGVVGGLDPATAIAATADGRGTGLPTPKESSTRLGTLRTRETSQVMV
jgi:hypothetical protein